MEVDGNGIQSSIQELVAGMAGMMKKQDDLTNTVNAMEGNITEKVNNALKYFQNDMKKEIATDEEVRRCRRVHATLCEATRRPEAAHFQVGSCSEWWLGVFWALFGSGFWALLI